MTTTFTINPSFLSQTTASKVGYGTNYNFGVPGGRGNAAFMVGVDGNIYFPVWQSGTPSIAGAVVCGNSGNIINISFAKFVADGGVNGSNTIIVLPAKGTPYFWMISINANIGTTWNYSGILYKIINDTTVSVVNTLSHSTLSYDGEFSDNAVFVSEIVGEKIVVISLQTGYDILHPRTALASFSIVEHDTSPFVDWVLPSKLTPAFFDYAFQAPGSREEYNTFTAIPDASSTGYHFLFYVSKNAYTYMAANPSVSPTYAIFTRPGVYRYSGPFNGLDSFFDVTDQFALTDIGTFLNGSSSSNQNDDYYGMQTFNYHGTQYVMFSRSYVQTSDLFTTTAGTYAHILIYKWDGEVATKVFDTHSNLFNTVTNTGGTPATGYPPVFILTGLNGDTLYYLWSDYNTLGYVVGGIVGLTFTPDPAFRTYFSDFHNTTYTDWVSSNTVGEDFSSFFTTYWVMGDDSALWMEMPWVITYLDNTQTNPSCVFTPKWEWADVDWNHHEGPSIDVYHIRDKQSVSDNRTRVRGRGRALQLNFQSSSGQPFNILGWSLHNDRNMKP